MQNWLQINITHSPPRIEVASWILRPARFASKFSYGNWRGNYYENIKEAIPEKLWIGANAYYHQNLVTNPGLARFWDEYRHIYSEPFRSYVEDILRSGEPVR